MNIQRYGNQGLVDDGHKALISFEILATADQLSIERDKTKFAQASLYNETFMLQNYTIAAFGQYNNLPGELKDLIKNNHLLPEILAKQVRFMYGQGPWLFKNQITNEKLKRVPVDAAQFARVWQWLNSWKSAGLADDVRTYLKRTAREYYYTEGVFSKWRFNKSRRIGGALPVRGLEHVPTTRVRLGKRGVIDITKPLEDEILDLVIYSQWDKPYKMDFEVFPRLNKANPLQHPVAINYTRDFGYGEEVYSFPSFYYGLIEWIKGSNLNPKYINSYLKNSLSAKLHVLIPDVWIQQKTETLKQICENNKSRDQQSLPLITTYDGLTDIGTTFSHGLVNKLIDKKLEKLSSVLSGEGENQGKAFISRKFQTEHGVEEWEFKEIPVKYKEFIQSIIEVDKRAVEVILAGKGLPPSISNVTKDGVFQSSGSDAYYNYMIYLNSLHYAEEFITEDINRALWINFPELEQQNVTLGFLRHVPERQEELQPKERIEKISQ